MRRLREWLNERRFNRATAVWRRREAEAKRRGDTRAMGRERQALRAVIHAALAQQVRA